MNQPSEQMKEALRLIDKLNMINEAVLVAFTRKGSLTADEYKQIYERTLKEWERKNATPNN